MVPRPINEVEKKRAAQWLHNIGTGFHVTNFKFGKDKVVCKDLRTVQYDLRTVIERGEKWLVTFNSKKIQLVSFT